MFSLCLRVFFSSPTVQVMLIRDFLYVGSVIDWQPIQGKPRLSPNVSWDLHPTPTQLSKDKRISSCYFEQTLNKDSRKKCMFSLTVLIPTALEAKCDEILSHWNLQVCEAKCERPLHHTSHAGPS